MPRQGIFDARVFDEIRACWIADQTHPNRGRAELPIPEIQSMAELIETAFVASLRAEEGVHPKFSIVLLGEDDAKADPQVTVHGGLARSLLQFSQPIALNPEALQKVAGCCDRLCGTLAVSPPTDKFDGY